MGLSLRNLGKKITDRASQVYDQANVFDNGRTYQQRAAVNNRSVLGQASHNAITNTAGNFVVKPLVRSSQAINQGIGNAELALAGRPTQNAQQYFQGVPNLNKFSGYTGERNQIIGDAITNAANIALPGSSKVVTSAFRSVAPKIVPDLALRATANAGVGAVGGGVSNLGTQLSADQIHNRGDVGHALFQGAQGGAVLGGAGTLALPVVKAGSGAVARQAPIVAQKAVQAIENPAVTELKSTRQRLQTQWDTSPPKARKQLEQAMKGVDNELTSVQQGGYIGKPKVTLKQPTSVNAPSAPNIDNLPAYLRQGFSQGKKEIGDAEAKYRAQQSQLRENGVPSFIRQGQATAEQLVRQALPTTSPPEIAGLLPATTNVVEGQGFTMRPKTNPVLVQVGQQISKIDRQLEQVRLGKSTKSPDEVRALVKQRGDLAASVDNPTLTSSAVGDSVVDKRLSVKPKVSISPEKLLDIKIARVQNSARKAELIQEKKNLQQENTSIAGLEPLSPYTGTPKSPNAFARAWQTVNGVISQHGTGGQEISRRLGEQRNQSEIGQQAFLDKIPAVTSLKKNDFTTFVQSLDKLDKGEPVQLPQHIQQAIGEWNQAIPEIRNRAVNSGLDVGDLGPNYFPRQYKDIFTSDRKMGQIAEQMVRDGKAKDLGEAMGQLQFMKNEYQRPFGNLEKTRQLDLPGYEQTPEALTNYLSRSLDRITKAEQFGAKNESLNELLAKAHQEGYNAAPGSTLDKYIKIALGDVDKGTTAHKVSGAVRSFNALRSLSAAGISNSTQLVNTATVGGVGRTAKAIVKSAVSPKARAEARQSGVLLDHAISNLASQGLGTGGKITRNIASPFFRQVEKFNRQTTGIVGKDFGNSLAKKVAKGNTKAEQTLRDKFGVKGEIGQKLTRDQEIQLQRKMVEIAQFKVDPMDLPGWVDSPIGKLVAQFRTFGYKQSDFVWNQILREAQKGNIAPLTRFIALAVPAGAASLQIKGAIKGTDYTASDESNASKATKALAAVGAFGLPGSEGQNLYKSSQYGNTIGGIAGTFGGPTASLVAETSVNADKARNGNSTALKKEAVRSIPAVGPSIANRIFPKKPQTSPLTDNNKAEATLEQLSASDRSELDAYKKKNPGSGAGFQALKSGKFLAQTGDNVKTYDTAQEAYHAIGKYNFEKSDTKAKVIGDTYYYKSKDGKVHEQPEIRHQFDQKDAKYKLEADRAYEAKDLNKWVDLTSKQIDNLESKKALYDPDTEQDEIDKITLQQENLQQKAEKYLSKGINGSGGSSGSRSNNIESPYKYNVSLNAGGSIAKPKISVKQSSSNRSVARKSQPKAKVSIKKSKV